MRCYSGYMTKNRTVRFDEDLYEMIELLAAADERSLNGQIVWLVRAGMELREMATRDGRLPRLGAGRDDPEGMK